MMMLAEAHQLSGNPHSNWNDSHGDYRQAFQSVYKVILSEQEREKVSGNKGCRKTPGETKKTRETHSCGNGGPWMMFPEDGLIRKYKINQEEMGFKVVRFLIGASGTCNSSVKRQTRRSPPVPGVASSPRQVKMSTWTSPDTELVLCYRLRCLFLHVLFSFSFLLFFLSFFLFLFVLSSSFCSFFLYLFFSFSFSPPTPSLSFFSGTGN